MKHIKKSAVFFVLVLVALTVTVIAACQRGDRLDTPTGLNIDIDYLVRWNGVDGSRNYVLEVYHVATGQIEETTTRRPELRLARLDAGEYIIRVMAVPMDTQVHRESYWSSRLSFRRYDNQGVVFELFNNNTEYRIVSASHAQGDITILDEYRGRPVTEIGARAFRGNNRLTGVTIGANIRSIGEQAFLGATNLAHIHIPDSVVYIGAYAFSSNSSLRSIRIPNGVSIIRRNTFANSRLLSEVIFGNNVTTIEDQAFLNCIALTQIVIPDSVTSIGEFSFAVEHGRYTSSLTSVSFGSGLTTIGFGAFSGNTLLENVSFNQNSSLTSIESFAFAHCHALANIILPDGLISIAGRAFNDARGLYQIHIPDSVTSIGAVAFFGTRLYNDTIAAGETFVYADRWLVAFSLSRSDRAALESISPESFRPHTVGIADGVFAVDWRSALPTGCGMFIGFYNLQTVSLPNSIRYIGDHAFFADIPPRPQQPELPQRPRLWSVILPDNGVQHIGTAAFAGQRDLMNLSLGEGLITIGTSAFSGCVLLTNASDRLIRGIPQSVRNIGRYAFRGTGMWNSPGEGNVVYVGNQANGYWVVGFNGNLPIQVELREGTVGIGEHAFLRAGFAADDTSTLTFITGLSNVRHINRSAFYQAANLRRIELNDEIERIEDFTFSGAAALRDIYLPESLRHIGRSAFNGTVSLTRLDLSNTKVETIGNHAFFRSGIEELDLGNYLISIGDHAFSRNEALINLNIPNTVQSIGYRAFFRNIALKEVDFGSSITYIGGYAFSGNTNIERIEIPSSVRVIGAYAFHNTSGVTELILHYGVETIGNYAFFGMTGLTSVIIPASVISIGNFAFRGNNYMTSIFLPSSLAYVGAHAFSVSRDSELAIYTNASAIPRGWNLRWNSSRRPVVFNARLSDNGDYIDSVTKGEILYSNALGGIGAPHRMGYHFIGWGANRTLAIFSADDIRNAEAGAVLFAVWRAV